MNQISLTPKSNNIQTVKNTNSSKIQHQFIESKFILPNPPPYQKKYIVDLTRQNEFTKQLFFEFKTTRPATFTKEFGNNMLNKPYPVPELVEKGLPQNSSLEIHSHFKWFQNEPFFLDKEKKLLFIHAQIEGGIDWLNTEIQCRDLFLVLKKDEPSGKFKEMQSKQLFEFDGQNVARIVELIKSEKEKDLIKLKVEEGTYNIITEISYTCEVNENGINLKKI